MAFKWLVGTASQGSNDAFVEAEIATGLSNVARTAYRVRVIEWYHSSLPGVDCQLEMILRRNSAAAISWTSQAVIAGLRKYVDFTTSGAVRDEAFPNARHYSKDTELLIVEETLYLDVDSNATSQQNQVIVRVGVETRSITDNERLAILAASAS